ncbi:MAG: barstar family protein [Pirellulales bacterium]
MNPPPYFQFVDDPAAYRNSSAMIIRIPRKARGKEKLLGAIARPLHFPRYFGWNWDALDECLRDLSWLRGVKQIVLVHDGVPFTRREEQLATYLQVLVDVMSLRRADPAGLQIEVVFPKSAEAIIGR